MAFIVLKQTLRGTFLISKNRQNKKKSSNHQYDIFRAQNRQIWQL